VLRRLPLLGGPVEDLWSNEFGGSIRVLALSSTHLYWAPSTADTCQETLLFRRGKIGGATQMLASFPERCPRGLVLHGDRLSLATSVPLGGAKNAIYRIRP